LLRSFVPIGVLADRDHCFPTSRALGAVLLVKATLKVRWRACVVFSILFTQGRFGASDFVRSGDVLDSVLTGGFVVVVPALIHPLMVVFGVAYFLALSSQSDQ